MNPENDILFILQLFNVIIKHIEVIVNNRSKK